MSKTIGVLGLQGSVIEHLRSIEALGLKSRTVKYPSDLNFIDGLIIPGGESTTIAKLSYGKIKALDKSDSKNQNINALEPDQDLIPQIKKLALSGLPIYGTCMGSIFLAKNIENNLNQLSMQLIDISVSRNAFGPQKNSFEVNLNINSIGINNYQAIFIRAPLFIDAGQEVEILATLPDSIILSNNYKIRACMVRQKNFLASAFHPELTNDLRIHKYFIENFVK